MTTSLVSASSPDCPALAVASIRPAPLALASLRNLISRDRYENAEDLALAVQFGETFGYEDISSGGMGSVQINISRLPPDDIAAIAEYLVSLE